MEKRTYSKRMKSLSKINAFYFVLKQKKGKKGGGGRVTENVNNRVNTTTKVLHIAIKHLQQFAKLS